MTIEKLKSGNYRISQMVNGKRYRATVDHKPTSAEAVKIMSGLLDKKPVSAPNKTFSNAFNDYLDMKSNVLSPSTIRGYIYAMKNVAEGFKNKRLNQITAVDVQKVINDHSATHAPKSVKNLSTLIMSVLDMYGLDIKRPTLPQKEVKEIYIPTESDVHRILDALKGDEYEVPILLSVMGLRRSEICSLELSDLDENNVLFIHKGKVQTPDNSFITRDKTKNDTSTRKVVLPPYIADLIRQQGFIYRHHPNRIIDHLKAVEKQLGIPTFPPHKMRHFFASYLHDKGYSNKQIMAVGGWKTDNVLKTIYQHALAVDEAKQNIATDIGTLF